MSYSLTLSEIKQILKKYKLLITTNIKDDDNTVIEKLTYDSRNVDDKTFFICKGVAFKDDYLKMAVESKAIGFVSEKYYDEYVDTVPFVQVNSATKALSVLAIHFYDRPSQSFFLTGITGTAGKTTTTYMIHSICDANAKKETGIISTNETYCGTVHKEAENTTPESLKLQELFAEAKENDIPYVTMEVSSQAYSVNRVYDQIFDIGIFMNIDKDHIGGPEHPSYEHYRSCKLELIKNSRTMLVYSRTKELDSILETASESDCNLILFDVDYTESDANCGCEETIATYECRRTISELQQKLGRQLNIYKTTKYKSLGSEGYSFTVSTPIKGDFEFTTNLTGFFNLVNATAAVTAAFEADICVSDIRKGISNVFVPGRMNIYNSGENVIIVDYAHNRLTLEEFLKSVETDYSDYIINIVIGAAGKNHLRREDIGKLCGTYAHHLYLTEEDPDFEDPTEICEDIARYIPEGTATYEIIPDRETAIKKAIADNKGKKALIAILGKGSEKFSKFKGTHIPYKSDSTVVEENI